MVRRRVDFPGPTARNADPTGSASPSCCSVALRSMTSRSRSCCPSARCCTSFPRAATTSRRYCSGCISPTLTMASTVYYRSRPLMLALGFDLEDAAAGPLARAGSFSDGRDIGVVFNMPGSGGPTVLPACGGVGAQYTPAAGWAQAIRYRREVFG